MTVLLTNGSFQTIDDIPSGILELILVWADFIGDSISRFRRTIDNKNSPVSKDVKVRFSEEDHSLFRPGSIFQCSGFPPGNLSDFQ